MAPAFQRESLVLPASGAPSLAPAAGLLWSGGSIQMHGLEQVIPALTLQVKDLPFLGMNAGFPSVRPAVRL